MTDETRKLPTGIGLRHSRSCGSRSGEPCTCKPTYTAWVFDPRHRAKVWKSFATLRDAKAWRAAATTKVHKGERIVRSTVTLREAAERWLAEVQADPPTAFTRGGLPYKPSVIRSYSSDLELHVLPDLGAVRLSDVSRGDVQALVNRMVGRGLSGSKVRNTVIAISVVYRYAIREGLAAVYPTGVEFPSGSKPRDRAASMEEAAELLAALPPGIRPVYATAFYAGLRRGELRGLRWADVDLAAGMIHVRRGWDDVAGEIAPKSVKGARGVPMVALLRDHLVEHRAAQDGRAGGWVFGSIHGRPFTPSSVRKQAAAAWEAANVERKERGQAPLVPIGLHECRHTFVSLMADAGLPLERIGDYVGHSSTFMVDRYRHLLAGHEDETRRLMDAYLARADTTSRIEQLEGDA